MNKYTIIDIASPELPMEGPDGKFQSSLPILSILDRNTAVAEALKRWPTSNLLETFYGNLEININGLLQQNQRKVENPFMSIDAQEIEEEYVIDALQLAGYLIHGRNPLVVNGESTDFSVIMYLICDAIKNLKPLIITGISFRKLCDDYHNLSSIDRLLVINMSKQSDCYEEKTDLSPLVFFRQIETIADMAEGKVVSPLKLCVPANPNLLLSSSDNWHSLFENPCEQTLSCDDIKEFPSISIIS